MVLMNAKEKKMQKYDGWVVKSYCARNPFLIPDWFRTTRKKVIEHYDEMFGKGCWKALRKRGDLELVKVKFVEVDNRIA